jgi:hypothetical protein
MASNQFKVNRREDFSGGVNYAYGSRQIEDNESPEAPNCEFKGKTGVGNRMGYTEVGSVTDSRTGGYGLTEYHTSSLDMLIKFASNGTNIAAYSSTGSTWSALTGTTFTNAINVDTTQATIMTSVPTPGTPVSTNGVLFTFNGTDAMQKIDGTTVGAHTGGTKGFYGEYYDKRLWCVDEQYKDVLDFTANGTSSNPGTITIRPGNGAEIRALKSFKDSLYVFLYPFGIYQISPASSANTFTVALITNAIGCVSHRSVCQVGEDLLFAADDGVYSLGDVANYAGVIRTTNKSQKVQRIFDNLSGTNKGRLTAVFHNFKYRLFYSLYGTTNESCLVYDVRYRAWQDWRNMPGQDCTTYTDATDTTKCYFIEPSSGSVMKMDTGTTDNGTAISSYWLSKSFTEELPDFLKIYDYTTFLMGALNGTANFTVIFDDTTVTAPKTLSQNKPQGGMGRDALGIKAMGDATNTNSAVTIVANTPQRLKASGKYFSIQYKLASSGDWRLDAISQHYMPMDFYVFPSSNRLN